MIILKLIRNACDYCEKFKIGATFMHFLIPSSSVARCNRRLASDKHSGKMERGSFIKKEFTRRTG